MNSAYFRDKIEEYKKELKFINKITQLIENGATGYDLAFIAEQQRDKFREIFKESFFIFKKIGNEKVKDLTEKSILYRFHTINKLKYRIEYIQEEMGYLEYKINRSKESDHSL